MCTRVLDGEAYDHDLRRTYESRSPSITSGSRTDKPTESPEFFSTREL